MPSYACKEFVDLQAHINHMIDNQQFEEAAQYLADKDKTNISEGYRGLAAFISAYYELENRKDLSELYLVKGCELGDYNSCREHTYRLVQKGEYLKAESILLDVANKHSDPQAAGYLVSLYHNRKWDGFNKEKAKHWQYKVTEFAKQKSNN